MDYRTINSEYYCGVDIHPKRSQICVLDNAGKKHINRNMQNNFNNFKQLIQPFIHNIVVGCESTYAYYWLADGCHHDRIPFYLGHALYMKAIGASKKKSDKIDAQTIAELMRTNFFPEAYPYPKLMRPARDLLRRRHRLVSIRSEAYSHIQMVAHQYAIEDVGSSEVKSKQAQQNVLAKFEQHNLTKLIETDLDIINALNPLIAKVEKEIQMNAVHHNPQDLMILQTAPGIGDIMSLVILYETHDISRFPTHQKYASYSRVVRAHQTSNGKIVGKKHSKMGNPYLKWAFNAIITYAQQGSERISKYYQKLESRYGRRNARARIGHQFNIAVYYMLKNKQPFNEARFLNIS